MKSNSANEAASYTVGIHTITPAKVPEYLDSLFCQRFPENNDEKSKYTLIVMATGGMRNLPPRKFEALDIAIRDYVNGENGFNPVGRRYETVTGKQEGLYGWVAANYLLRNCPMAGILRGLVDYLEMDGETVQIVFRSDAHEGESRVAAKNPEATTAVQPENDMTKLEAEFVIATKAANAAFTNGTKAAQRKAQEDLLKARASLNNAIQRATRRLANARTIPSNRGKYLGPLMRVSLWGQEYDLYFATYTLGNNAALQLHAKALEALYPPPQTVYDPSKPKGWPVTRIMIMGPTVTKTRTKTSDGRTIEGRIDHTLCKQLARLLLQRQTEVHSRLMSKISREFPPTIYGSDDSKIPDPGTVVNLLAEAPARLKDSFFVGGSTFYYTMRSTFGRDCWGRSKDAPHKMSEFDVEILEWLKLGLASIEWATRCNSRNPVNETHAANALFTATWVTTILLDAFGLQPDVSEDIPFQPYDGPIRGIQDTVEYPR